MGISQALLPLLPISLLPLLLLLTPPTAAAAFSCTGPTQACSAMLGYKVPNRTTYSSINILFQVPSMTQLFMANNLSATTPSSYPVPAGTIVRIPFPCSCSNGTGVSNRVPVYTVKAGDFLDHIARDIYGLFVTYQEIADANAIKDIDVILPGQRLVIPLPCSCDMVEEVEVLHYAYKVEGGDTFSSIAGRFGTKAETLRKSNGIGRSVDLKEEQILDVPLQVCSSSISKASPDSPLLVPGGYHALTAGGCVQCSCNSSSWRLQCVPADVFNSTCPRATCTASKLSLGGSTLGSSACVVTTCDYAGYGNGTIMTALTNTSTCPAGVAPPGNAANRLVGSSDLYWIDLLILCGITLFSGFL